MIQPTLRELVSAPAYRALFDASPNPYLVLDRRLHIATANRAYLASTSRELADIVGRWAWDAFPADPATVKQAIASFERVIETGQVDTMALLRFDIPDPAGEGAFRTRYWSITHSPVFDEAGEVAFVLQHPIDVTELERLRDAARDTGRPLALVPEQTGIFTRAQHVYETNLTLLASLDRLQSMFQRAPSFMAILRGPDHVYELVNDAITELMGVRDYLGHPVREVVPEIGAQGFVSLLDEVYRTGKPVVAHGRAVQFRRGPDETLTECFIDFIYQPLFDAAGAVEGIFVEGTDVTERYRAHHFVEQTLRQEARNKDEFLAMLAHELRNPLAPIGAAADLLALGRLDQGHLQKAAAIIRRQVAHMTGLVNDLLDVSRVSRGLVTIDRLPTDMLEVVHDALEQLHALVSSRGHRLDVQVPATPVMVSGDKKRLVQVLANLLSNAAKYTPEAGDITVSLAARAGKVVLEVSDSGIGMSPALQVAAFGLFAQAHRTPDRTQGGLGIGLALVKNIVELHGGTVHAYSAGQGWGSRFTVILPGGAASA